MVKVTGPMMSMNAGGTLADTITHAKWKDRHTVRKHSVPSNPHSPMQTGGRAMMGFLSKEWANLPAADQEDWIPVAMEKEASPYTAFLSQNLKWWKQFLAPSQTYPAARAAWWGWWNMNPVALWVANRVRIYGRLSAVNSNWGVMIFASPTPGFDTHPGNAVLIEPLTDVVGHYWFWTPPERRTWYINTRRFSVDGYPTVADAEQTAAP